jgi:hypothetical protein
MGFSAILLQSDRKKVTKTEKRVTPGARGRMEGTGNKLSKWKIKRSADFADYTDFVAKPRS